MNRTMTARLGVALYRAFEDLGADAELLSLIGSLGDTMSDEWVIQALEDYNRGRSVFDAPELQDDPPADAPRPLTTD